VTRGTSALASLAPTQPTGWLEVYEDVMRQSSALGTLNWQRVQETLRESFSWNRDLQEALKQNSDWFQNLQEALKQNSNWFQNLQEALKAQSGVTDVAALLKPRSLDESQK
jgi:hypothetical protein